MSILSARINELKKKGKLDQAYSLALQAVEEDLHNLWKRKTLAWCLYDLVKRAVVLKKLDTAKAYLRDLVFLQVTDFDMRLKSAVSHLERQVIREETKTAVRGAGDLHKPGSLKAQPDLAEELIVGLASAIYKRAEELIRTNPPDVTAIRRALHEYIVLPKNDPSELHSKFLHIALSIANDAEFNFLVFLKMWDLSKLRPEDFHMVADRNKVKSSLARTAISTACRLIFERELVAEVDYIIPYLDRVLREDDSDILLMKARSELILLRSRTQ